MKSALYKKILVISVVVTLLAAAAIIISAVLIKKFHRKNALHIQSVQILFDESPRNGNRFFCDSDKVKLSVNINGGYDENKFEAPKATWYLCGSDVGCTLEDNYLVFDECHTVGKTGIGVRVQGENEVVWEEDIEIIPKMNSVLSSISIQKISDANVFVEYQPIDRSDYSVVADFTDYKINIINYILDYERYSLEKNEIQATYSFDGVEKSAIAPVSVIPKQLQSIEITKEPYKTTYIEGEAFDADGMEVTAVYEYFAQQITGYFINNNILTAENNAVKIIYGEIDSSNEQIFKEVDFEVSVNKRKLKTLEVDSANVKTEYVRGQLFDSAGLKVYAIYDYGKSEIHDYSIDKVEPLTEVDEEVKLSYSENGIVKSHYIKISVEIPYANTRNIVFTDSPFDADLSWRYSYMGEDGLFVTDDTAADEHELIYDVSNGSYSVPVNAIVRLTVVNPIITDVIVDGIEQGMTYPKRSVEFNLKQGTEPVSITFKKMSGRRTLLFRNDTAKIFFSYSSYGAGRLNEKDLANIALIFGEEENVENTYNVYEIDGTQHTFTELCSLEFDDSVEIIVSKSEVNEGTRIILVYWEGLTVTAIVDKENPMWISFLPALERVGYNFSGWMETDNGASAKWEKIDKKYTGAFLGKWYGKTETEDGSEAECYITFYSDGSLYYETYTDGTDNVSVKGFYQFDEISNTIEIIDVDADDTNNLLSSVDFVFDLDSAATELIVVDGYVIEKIEITLNKVN